MTVRGQFVLPSEKVEGFDWTTMTGSLVENVVFQRPELPASWQQMSLPDRQSWARDFEASEEGKRMLAANEQLLAERVILEFDVDDDGKFVVYDVPPGQFAMQAAGQMQQEDRIYILQAFGQIKIEEVDELDLAAMPLEVMRLLRMGEEAPEVKGVDESGDDRALAEFRGQHVLLAFGMFGSPAFQQTAASLREAAESSEHADQLKVVAISVDEDRDKLLEVLADHPVPNCIALGGWDTDTLGEYGIKQLPAFWLIDPEGNIVLTGQQFLFELNRTQFSLVKLVDEAISGRLKIGGDSDEAASAENTDAEDEDN